VVANYLRLVNRQADRVFLHEVMAGKRVAKKAGDRGVLKQTRLEDYQRGLPDFDLIDMATARKPAGQLFSHYSNSVWTRKARAKAKVA
jgi:hypothetical protein